MEHLLDPLLFGLFFLGATALLHEITKRVGFPYVVALLLLGFGAHFLFYITDTEPHFSLSPDMIFFVLLPLLLFGAALHINIHHFKLQFKTISFLATIGLSLSVVTVGVLMAKLLGLPLGIGLLFGAIISATDPIAVLALFKTIGAPKRLSLLVDGESMFNDATSVILFRVILSVVLGTYVLSTASFVSTLGSFLYVFFGSLLVGAIFGVLGSLVIERVQNNLFVETSITVVLALASFIIPEHFWHLSGVISCVITGMVVGNLGETKVSGEVAAFLEDFWEYISIIAIAIVFFFAAFEIDFAIFNDWWLELSMVIGIVLVARAVSVYTSFLVTNYTPFFKDEPNISVSWQHVLNWGGLRGVIPLVLVFSLPDTFVYKERLLLFTLGVLLFSLFVNGTTIQWLLKKLGLHLPKKEEEIIDQELDIFELEQARQRLKELPDVSKEKEIIARIEKRITTSEKAHRKKLLALASTKELETSLVIQALRIERAISKDLFRKSVINESVYFDLQAQYDIQEDALDYPEIFAKRAITAEGMVDTKQSFRRRLRWVREWAQQFPVLSRVLNASQRQLITERYMMLKARMIGNDKVIEYLDHVAKVFGSNATAKKALTKVRARYREFRQRNMTELQSLATAYPGMVKEYSIGLVESFLAN